MTNADIRTRSDATDAPPGGRTRRKSVLFCPGCGFEAPAGDCWNSARGDDGELSCPDCRTVVAVR